MTVLYSDGVSDEPRVNRTGLNPSVVVPIAAVVIAGIFALANVSVQRGGQFVGIAVEILARPVPTNGDETERQADRALRAWAVDLLVKYSPVEPNSDAERALRQGDVILQAGVPISAPDRSLERRFPFVGPLPDGCMIEVVESAEATGSGVAVYSEPDASSEVVSRLSPNFYPATEYFQNPPNILRANGFFNVEQGWVSGLNVEGFPGCIPGAGIGRVP